MVLSRKSNHKTFYDVKPWKKNQQTKLIQPVFRVISGMMTVKKHVTAGQSQKGTTLESGASIFVMTKQRFPNFFTFDSL